MTSKIEPRSVRFNGAVPTLEAFQPVIACVLGSTQRYEITSTNTCSTRWRPTELLIDPIVTNFDYENGIPRDMAYS
jgi:hypothetical protein